MRLGLYLGYWGASMGPERLGDTAREAERLGYHSVWAAEAYGSDAATVLAFVAARTTTIKDFRGLLEQGAARDHRSLRGFDIAPIVNAYVSDDLERARDVMRPGLASYVGGMGSREQNFYNRIVQRYGFEAEDREIQDLYLAGKKAEAMAAVPDALADAIALLGPKERIRDRIEVWKAHRVPTLLIGSGQPEALRLLAELCL